jgi:hypothetical protein
MSSTPATSSRANCSLSPRADAVRNEVLPEERRARPGAAVAEHVRACRAPGGQLAARSDARHAQNR